jgi:hypothetical protein
MKSNSSYARKLIFSSLLILSMAVNTGCQLSLIDLPVFSGGERPTALPTSSLPTPTPLPMAQVNFIALLPAPLGANETLAIAILDEVTGLALNNVLYPMQSLDPQTYSVSLPMALDTVVKYRYVRRSNVQLQEDSSTDVAIRYRLYNVNGPGETRDVIASWIDSSFSGKTGTIEGEVKDENGTPLPNIMVTAGGVQTITDSAGRFDLEGLPSGTHNLVAYALDGSYQTYQQGANVVEELTTPVELKLKTAEMVTVTFNVKVPSNTLPGAPVRLGGNLFQLGNTFADLRGGLSTIADRMPILNALPDGSYTIALRLPAGADIRYKYTLGDGFWNAEHSSTGEFLVRQLIVPQSDATINDVIETWQAGNSAPILFEVDVPASTPVGDVIYIQFNPYGWTEPVPIWPIGNNRWVYKLYSPLSILGSFGYRYCRAGQCGSADDALTAGDSARGRQITTSLAPQDIKDAVKEWAWLGDTQPGTLVGSSVSARQSTFLTGVEFQPTQHPNWVTSISQAMGNTKALGSNWVVLTPTWTFANANPLMFGPVPGKDSFWNDTYRMVSQARELNMNVGLFPTPRFTSSPEEFWASAPRTADWWQDWFNHYRAFLINYADLATQSGAQALILGGDWLGPTLPNGTLADGVTSSGVPDDAGTRWKTIIAEVRTHFRGTIYWALPFETETVTLPLDLLTSTDGLYLLWSIKISDASVPVKTDMIDEAGRLLDTSLSPLASALGKQLIIAPSYPSVNGAASGCLSDGKGGCLHWTDFNSSNAEVPSANIDLQLQADIYESILTAVNQRPWVGGFISRGYYPPTILQDKSASVHGKPAADLLWYWYPRFLGMAQ